MASNLKHENLLGDLRFHDFDPRFMRETSEFPAGPSRVFKVFVFLYIYIVSPFQCNRLHDMGVLVDVTVSNQNALEQVIKYTSSLIRLCHLGLPNLCQLDTASHNAW